MRRWSCPVYLCRQRLFRSYWHPKYTRWCLNKKTLSPYTYIPTTCSMLITYRHKWPRFAVRFDFGFAGNFLIGIHLKHKSRRWQCFVWILKLYKRGNQRNSSECAKTLATSKRSTGRNIFIFFLLIQRYSKSVYGKTGVGPTIFHLTLLPQT